MQPGPSDSASNHWLLVFTFAFIFTLIRWGAALMFGAVAKRTHESSPTSKRRRIASLVGLVRLAGSLLGPVIVSVFNSLFLVHLRGIGGKEEGIGAQFYFGWVFVFCAAGLAAVMIVNWMVLCGAEARQKEKDDEEIDRCCMDCLSQQGRSRNMAGAG